MTNAVQPIRISLTQFLTFIAAKDAKARISAIKLAKKQIAGGYNIVADVYKASRECISQSRGQQLTQAQITTIRQRTHGMNPQDIIDGYNKFIGTKTYSSQPVPKKIWHHGNLEVVVNPEITLIRNGLTQHIKIWFKSDRITKRDVEIIHQMMYDMIVMQPKEEARILEVRRGTLVSLPNPLPDPTLRTLLQAEAQYYAMIWPTV